MTIIEATTTCKKCNGAMKPSKAIVCKLTGYPDFPGDNHACTVSPDPRQPELVDCFKCSTCGFSITSVGSHDKV